MEGNSEILIKNYILFFFEIQILAKEFCCGFKIRTGNLFIATIFIVISLVALINSFLNTTTLYIIIIIPISSFIIIVFSILIFISTLRSHVRLNYYGYIINACHFYLEQIYFFIGFIYFTKDKFSDSVNLFYHIMDILVFLVLLMLFEFSRLYTIWINYSYLIYLKRRNVDYVETDTNNYIIDNK